MAKNSMTVTDIKHMITEKTPELKGCKLAIKGKILEHWETMGRLANYFKDGEALEIHATLAGS